MRTYRLLRFGLFCLAVGLGTPLRAQTPQLAISQLLGRPADTESVDDPVLTAYSIFERTRHARVIRPDEGRGYVIYPFGHERPVVRCPRLNACMILLESGEALTDQPMAGDTERWIIETSVMGSGQESRLVVIKPQACGIETNMLIPTTRRVYELALVSDRCDESASETYTHLVKFWYPEEMRADGTPGEPELEKVVLPALDPKALSPAVPRPEADPMEATQNETPEAAPAVNRNYEVDRGSFLSRKDYPWIPTDIFDDGTRTYVVLPDQPGTARLPILYEMEGGDRQVLNYVIQGDTLVADRVLEHGVLVVGTGDGPREIEFKNRSRARNEEEEKP